MSVERTEKHAVRYPVGLFTDELWTKAGFEGVRVDREKLHFAIELVQKFFTWIDGVHCSYPKCIREAEGGT